MGKFGNLSNMGLIRKMIFIYVFSWGYCFLGGSGVDNMIFQPLCDPTTVVSTVFFINSHTESQCYVNVKINLLIDVQLIS
jgi:hypothetical protein